MNSIYLDNIVIVKNRIKYNYTIKGEWQKYFNSEEMLWVEYSENVTRIPDSIAVIPLLTNLLPIIWLCDATIYIDEIDETFYESIQNIKNGYMNMFPMLNFKGNIMANKYIKNKDSLKKNTLTNSAVFFSGGVDAFSTLLSHINENPTLITVWGADVFFDDRKGWNKVKNHVCDVSNEYGIKKLFIKSNFRYFINEKELNTLVQDSGDGWWHGFQCGIGLVGHAAPYAFKENLYKVYIASSYTSEYKGTTASVPSTDGNVKFAFHSVYHDQYEIDRQEKIKNIVDYSQKNEKPISLRVCWKSIGGTNCCNCEKCYRTIMGLIAEKANPNNFGFLYTSETQENMISDLKKIIIIDKVTTLPFWEDIQNRFVENNIVNKDFDWFIEKDLKLFNYSFSKIIKRGIMKIKRTLK